MEKKNLDWANLNFDYRKTDYRYVCHYRDGVWGKGELTGEDRIILGEDAGVLQYSQSVFEGLKAYETADGRIVTFRPDLNAQRLYDSACRLEIPPVSVEQFLEGIDQVVRANAAWVPPFETGATLYIRPYIFATGNVIGVKPSREYQFRIFATPVGPYFKGGSRSIVVKISDFDRAAPRGTGNIKAGLNYAMSLHPLVVAHNEGFAENIFLDARTHTRLEETGGANILLVDRKGKLVTPGSDSILPSITRRSIEYVAENYLGMEIEERDILLEEVEAGEFVECGLCGTAAVLSPVGKINNHGKETVFADSAETMGPVLQKIYDTLTGIQKGTVEAPEGWIREIR